MGAQTQKQHHEDLYSRSTEYDTGIKEGLTLCCLRLWAGIHVLPNLGSNVTGL